MRRSTTGIIPNRRAAVPRIALLALLLLMASLGFAPAPIYRAERDPNTVAMRSLAGDWHLHYMRVGDNVIDDGMATWVIDKGRMKNPAGGSVIDITLDATKDPKHFDFCIVDLKWHHKGIYQLKGNTLTVYFHFGRDGRPTDFAGSNGKMILERKKR